MIYTSEDLKNRKIILLNDNQKITQHLLETIFNEKFDKHEEPGDLYYVAGDNDDYDGFSAIEIKGNLQSDGSYKIPNYLHGYSNMFEFYKCENLPIVKATKIKIN